MVNVQLRTKQQLGYIVHSSTQNNLNISGLQFIVQSSHASPDTIQERIDEFLLHTLKQLEEMEEDQFSSYLQATITRLTEKDKKLEHAANRFWQEITNKTFVFNRQNLQAESIRNATKQVLGGGGI